ncbi:MAG: WYL domain-containing protein [Lachnospiraceae bacterium]|nr:WYL domain-containing protein [Lachnospiraceae bacterium]
MPKGTNQKLKLYYLAKIMVEKTDDDHSLTMQEIRHLLEGYEVTADRKSLYDDIQTLGELGIEVIGERIGREYHYHVGQKNFELAELKLLVDAIQSSKFITEKKSNELIKKLTGMVSEYEARELKRQVVVQGRIKTMNESIYYVVDEIHRAIANNKKIRFEYYQWNTKKELELKREELYEVSPWALMWDDENYYLIAHVEEEKEDLPDGKPLKRLKAGAGSPERSSGAEIKHYRVDKIRNIEILKDRRQGRDIFREFDVAAYAKKSFGMFGGEETEVAIEFADPLAGVFIDRFGKEITILKGSKAGWSKTWVKVAMSGQFLGWIFALGKNVRITGPEEVVKLYKNRLKEETAQY